MQRSSNLLVVEPVKTITSVGLQTVQPQQLSKPKFTPIRPAPQPTSLLTPVVFTPLKNPSGIKRNKPATVREMLRTKKMERQRQQMLQRQQQEEQQRLLQEQRQHEQQHQRQQQQRQQQHRQQRQQQACQIIHHQVPSIMGRLGDTKTKGHSSAGKSSRVASGKKKGRPLTPRGATIADDKKEIHRLNERHRHQNMNQAIRQLVSVLPNNPAPETETKQFVLQKASDYIAYLKEKIEGACDDMAVVHNNNEGGLMSFDIPFENKTGSRRVRVPPSKPITYSDLQSLLGPTSALQISEPPKHKHIIKPVQRLKPKSATQPWLEINIKMNVSPYKTSSYRGAPSFGGLKKKSNSARKKAGKKHGSGKVVGASRGGHTIVHDEQVAPDHSPYSASWANIKEIPHPRFNQANKSRLNQANQTNDYQDQPNFRYSAAGTSPHSQMNQADSSQSSNSLTQSSVHSRSSVQSQSSSQSWQRLSDYCTPDDEEADVEEADLEEVDDSDVDVDLTCVDELSDDDEGAVHGAPMMKTELEASNRSGGIVSPDTQMSPSQDIPAWIRYGSSYSPVPWDQALDSKLQIEHSYSARELSPRTLQALAKLSSEGPEDLTASESDKGNVATRQSPTYHNHCGDVNTIDSILKSAVLDAPPDECIPPRSPLNGNNINSLQAFGLDFDDDSESSLGSLSQCSPDMFEVEHHDHVVTSFAPKQSSMRRSWINGYQLFTKINHPRIKRSWPGLQGREITRLLGQSWKDLSDKSKKLYSVRACEWNQWYREIRSQKKTEDY